MTLLGMAILADGALITKVIVTEHEYQSHVSTVLVRSVSSERVPLLRGFSPTGTDPSLISPIHGWAVRYASRTCPYCSRDTQWKELAPLLEAHGYPIVVLLPQVGDAISDKDMVPSDASQIALVDMNWIKRFRLSVTPSLLIFSRDGRLIWSRQGMLLPDDPESVMREIGSLNL